MRFERKTAIITGAANGIGKACAIQMAKEGAKVAILDLDQSSVDKVGETIREAGGTALSLAVDITKKDQIEDAVAKTLSEFGKIDILVNNAGAGWKQKHLPFHETPDDGWRWIIDLNINGTLEFTHAVLPHMVKRKYGKIVNVASIAATIGIPNLAVYAASKGAMISFTKSLAMELGAYNINVNCASPGMVSPNTETKPCDGNYLGRTGSTDEMAAVIAFLASDDASFVTGCDYLVDGGRVLGPRGM